MELTKETVGAVLEKPETASVLMETLKEKGFNVIPQKDYDNFIQTERARIASEKTSEIYNGIDKDVFEESGIKKNPEEKTYDFTRRAIKTYKDKESTYQQKIQDLENKIKEGSQDQTLKAQLEAYQQKEAQYQASLNEKDTLIFKKDVSYDIISGLANLKFKTDFPQVLLTNTIELEKAKLLNSAKIDNGKIVYYGEDGKVLLDDKAQIASASYLLKERLKEIIDTGRKQEGAGSGNPEANSGGKVQIPTSVPGDVKSQPQLMDYLLKCGLVKGSNEMNTAFTKLSPGLSLR